MFDEMIQGIYHHLHQNATSTFPCNEKLPAVSIYTYNMKSIDSIPLLFYIDCIYVFYIVLFVDIVSLPLVLNFVPHCQLCCIDFIAVR